jgi:hypothetical protein
MQNGNYRYARLFCLRRSGADGVLTTMTIPKQENAAGSHLILFSSSWWSIGARHQGARPRASWQQCVKNLLLQAGVNFFGCTPPPTRRAIQYGYVLPHRHPTLLYLQRIQCRFTFRNNNAMAWKTASIPRAGKLYCSYAKLFERPLMAQLRREVRNTHQNAGQYPGGAHCHLRLQLYMRHGSMPRLSCFRNRVWHFELRHTTLMNNWACIVVTWATDSSQIRFCNHLPLIKRHISLRLIWHWTHKNISRAWPTLEQKLQRWESGEADNTRSLW